MKMTNLQSADDVADGVRWSRRGESSINSKIGQQLSVGFAYSSEASASSPCPIEAQRPSYPQSELGVEDDKGEQHVESTAREPLSAVKEPISDPTISMPSRVGKKHSFVWIILRFMKSRH